MEFAFVSEKTSTEAFYLTMIEPEFRKEFEKIVTMNYRDHAPRHFHVRHADAKALVAGVSRPTP